MRIERRENFLSRKATSILEGRSLAIGRIADAWLNPDSLWMRRAEREIPGHTPYSREMVGACLASVFTGYNDGSLREWVKRDLGFTLPLSFTENGAGRPASFRMATTRLPARDVLILLPSTIFAAAWQAATAVWLAGARVTLKPSRREPVFARLLERSVHDMTNGALPIRTWNVKREMRNFHRYAAIIAFGNDATIWQLRDFPGVHRRLIGFGTKVSVVCVGKNSLSKARLQDLVHRASWDVVLYETQGCLSPQCIYVEEGGEISPQQFAGKLADAMRELDLRLPRKVVDEDRWMEETFWQRWRFRESRGRALILQKRCIFHREPLFEPCGLKRVVFVTPIRHASDIPRRLGKWLTRLSTVAVSDPESSAQLKRKLGSCPAIRFCEIGRMHQPLPWWRNGGISLLRELCK